MKGSIRLGAAAVVMAVGLSVIPAGTSFAGSAGKRNTAIGLGAVAAYGVVKKKPLVAGLAGGGAIYSRHAVPQGREERAGAPRGPGRRVYRRGVYPALSSLPSPLAASGPLPFHPRGADRTAAAGRWRGGPVRGLGSSRGQAGGCDADGPGQTCPSHRGGSSLRGSTPSRLRTKKSSIRRVP